MKDHGGSMFLLSKNLGEVSVLNNFSYFLTSEEIHVKQ
jgi:hypothetical protein